jgi:LemA protein
VTAVYVGLALLVVLLVAGAVSYNRFVTQRAAIDASWANIDGELQRRHDLVPNLVASVQGYAAHEREVLARVTDARAHAVAARPAEVPVDDQARAEDGLTAGLTSLLAVAESYPQLRADGVFLDLQRQLVETDERRRGSVPSNLVAEQFGFGPRRSFEILDPAAQHAPHVQP